MLQSGLKQDSQTVRRCLVLKEKLTGGNVQFVDGARKARVVFTRGTQVLGPRPWNFRVFFEEHSFDSIFHLFGSRSITRSRRGSEFWAPRSSGAIDHSESSPADAMALRIRIVAMRGKMRLLEHHLLLLR